jgi:low affinity Fe/Cu permease
MNSMWRRDPPWSLAVNNGSRPNQHLASSVQRSFGAIANAVSREVGRPWVFSLALLVVIVWGASGPLFGYSDTWQLVINTGTTIVTFLMVFLIQNSQNRDNAAIQVKLDELIRVSAAKNFFVGVEHLTDAEIERLRGLIEDRVKKGHGTDGGELTLQAAAEKANDAAEQAGS